MKNWFYKWKCDSIAMSLKFKINEMVEIIEKYNLLWETKNLFDFETEDAYFKTVTDSKVVYDFFIENFHIHIYQSEKEHIYSIRLKMQDEEWKFGTKEDGSYDISHPKNETMEVFIWYKVLILGITEVEDYIFKHGSWDRYFAKTWDKIYEEITDYTIDSKFNAEYSKKIEK